jgi:hypothetical protein
MRGHCEPQKESNTSYTGPMDYEALSHAVEFYYRDWIG